MHKKLRTYGQVAPECQHEIDYADTWQDAKLLGFFDRETVFKKYIRIIRV